MVNRLRRLRAVTRARGRWDPLQFNASLVVQSIAEWATRLRQPERAFRDPPACFSLLRPARISPAPRRPVYLLSMQLMEDWKSTAAEVYHSLLPWADLIEVRWFVVSKQRILMV